jgi:hypothetical protein
MTKSTPNRSRTKSPPHWQTKEECLQARHEAAYDEAVKSASWPRLKKVALRPPSDHQDDRALLMRLRDELASIGTDLLPLLERFRSTATRIDALIQFRTAQKDLSVLDDAIAHVHVTTSFARATARGAAKDVRGSGRRMSPARGRALSVLDEHHVFRDGLLDPLAAEVRDWQPTARDLGIIAICEGLDTLPDGWNSMTKKELLASEERAMRQAMRARLQHIAQRQRR